MADLKKSRFFEADYVQPKFFTDTTPVQEPPEQAVPTTNTEGDFFRGMRQGWEETKGMGYGAIAAAGAASGNDKVKQYGLENAKARFGASEAMGKETDSVSGIRGVGDAVDWAQHGLGYLAPMVVPSILSGGAGAIAAKTLAKSAIKNAVSKEAGSVIARNAAKKGAIAGGFGASYGQELGSIYPDMVEEGYDDVGRAALFAAPAAALDILPEARFVSKIANKSVTSGVGKEILKQAGAEGATEAGQSVIERAAAYKPLNDAAAWGEYVDAAALGALGGGIMGGVSSALRGKKDLLAPEATEPKNGAATLGLPNYDASMGELITFPDGSVMTKADAEKYGLYKRTGVDTSEPGSVVNTGIERNKAISRLQDRIDASTKGTSRDMFSEEFRLPPEYQAAMDEAVAYGQPAPVSNPGQDKLFDKSGSPTTKAMVKKQSQKSQLKNKIDSYLLGNLISAEKHTELVNDLETAKPDRVRKFILEALKEKRGQIAEASVKRQRNGRLAKVGELSGVKTNFKQLSAAEQKLKESRDAHAAAKEAVAKEKEAQLAFINEVVSGAEQQKQARHRVHLLTGILNDPKVSNKAAAFTKALKRFPMHAKTMTNEEKAMIGRHADVMHAFTQSGLQGDLFGGTEKVNEQPAAEVEEEQAPVGNPKQNKMFDKNGRPTAKAVVKKVGPKKRPALPKDAVKSNKVLAAEKVTNTNPTEAQKKSGNYAKDASQPVGELKKPVPAIKKQQAAPKAELSKSEESLIDAFLAGEYAPSKKAVRDAKLAAAEKESVLPDDFGITDDFYATDGVEMISLDSWNAQQLAREEEDMGSTYELEDSEGTVHELRFSTGKGTATPDSGVSTESAKKMVDNITSKWENAPVVHVMNFADLPKQMQVWLENHGERYAKGFITESGTVFILADNNADLASIKATLFHESLGHFGLRKEYGARLNDLMRSIYKSNAEIRGMADAYAKAQGVSIEIATEEALAEAQVNGGLNVSALQRLIAFVRKMARKMGMDLSISKSEVLSVLSAARDRVVAGPRTDTFEGGVAATRSATAQAQYVNSPYAGYAKGQLEFGWDKFLNTVMFTADLVERGAKAGLKAAKKFGDLMEEKMATRDMYEQKVARIMSRFNNLSDSEKAAANKFVQKSTLEQKWGYSDVNGYSFKAGQKEPTVTKVKVEADLAMVAEFGKLSKEAQGLVKELFDFNRRIHATLQYEVNREINQEFDSLKELVGKDPAKQAEIEEARKNSLAAAGNHLPSMEGPYASLRRFGNHVIVARSKEMAKAMKEHDTKAIAKMEADPDHYIVEFTDSRFAALKREDELKQAFPNGEVYSELRKDTEKLATQLPWEGIAKIKQQITGLPEDSKTKGEMSKLVTSLYLSMLSETSARKAELHRKGISGADGDMFRAFASRGAASAHYISSLQHSGELSRAVSDMQAEVSGENSGKEGNTKRVAVMNELIARYDQSLAYDESPLINAAMKMTSFWMLITSPAYYVQDALQPFMLSLPYMAAKYGLNKSRAAMTQAYSDVFTYVLKTKAHQLDINNMKLTDDEKAMLMELQLHGKLDLTLTQDMGRFIKGDDILDKGVAGKMTRALWSAPQTVELLNRVSTAVAAHRLARGDVSGMSEEKKTEVLKKARGYADDVVTHTHGNYSSFNAPRFFSKNGPMRLITQFRKYQLIQITLLARMLHQSLPSNDNSPGAKAERAVARRMALYMIGTHMAMTGLTGLPLALSIMTLFGADDGEPDEEKLRQWMAENGFNPQMIELLTRGAPAMLGLDLSGKVGMANTLSLLPFADTPKDRASFDKAVVASLGASVGMTRNMFDGASLMASGDYVKGTEKLIPRGVADAIKAFRFATEGVTNKQGDVLVKADEINAVDAVMQGLGLPTTKITDRTRKQSVMFEIEKHFDAESARLYHEFDIAFKAKGSADKKHVIEKWAALQKQRKEVGLSPQSPALLIKHAVSQRKREMKTIDGVQYTSQNRNLVKGL